jgi:hypothetical protein
MQLATAIVLPLIETDSVAHQARRLFATYRERGQQLLDCAWLGEVISQRFPCEHNEELDVADVQIALKHLNAAFHDVYRDLAQGTLNPADFNADGWSDVLPEQMAALAYRRVQELDTDARALIAQVTDTSAMRAVRSAAIAAAYAPTADPSTRITGYMRVALAQWRTGTVAASLMAVVAVSRTTDVRRRGESAKSYAHLVRQRLETRDAPAIPPEARKAIEEVIGPGASTGADLELRFMSEQGQRYWSSF